MEKAEQDFQNDYIRNAPIFLNWNDICNADMNELPAMLKRHCKLQITTKNKLSKILTFVDK